MAKNKVDYEALLPRVSLGGSIPHVIYQTYKMRDNLPEEIQANIHHISSLHAGWRYQLFDDADIEAYIRTYYEPLWRYYQRINPIYGAARADLFRYLLIYREGGVYLDIKSSLTQPLGDTLNPQDRFILTHWDNEPDGLFPGFGTFKELVDLGLPRGEYIQWSIIAVAGHPFLREVILSVLRQIDEYSPFANGVGLHGVIRTTGPLAYTQAIEKIRLRIDPGLYRILRKPQDIGLKYSIFEGTSPFEHKRVMSSNYNNKLDAVILNGSEFCTKYFHFYFYICWVLRVLGDKCRRWWGRN